jgi:hypothetical protein
MKNFKDEENGGILTGPKNILTSGPKVGNCTQKLASFGGMAKHLADDYNFPKKLAWKELQLHNSKLQDKPFSHAVKLRGDFNPSKDAFLWKGDAQLRDKVPAKVCDIERNNWKPSHPARHGHNKTIGKIPEYKPNPMKFLTRKIKAEGEEEEEVKRPFRKTHNFKSRPTPTIACNIRNIKSAFPTVFRK